MLPSSYDMAYNRLTNIEMRIQQDVQFAQEYSRIMKDKVVKEYRKEYFARGLEAFMDWRKEMDKV